MSDALVLLNPRAGRGLPAGWLERLRGSAGVELRFPDSPARLTEEARRAAAEGRDRVVVAGGDGTLHHAIQGLAGSSCALGIVPVGTGNDLAGALGIPGKTDEATHLALSGKPSAIDLGRAGERVFAGIAGVGLDGAVLDRLNRRKRPARGRARYAAALLRTLLSFVPPEVTLEFDDGGRFEGPVTLVAIANTPCYGGGMQIAPQASMNDGLLDLVIVGTVSRAELALVFPRVYKGRHLDHPAVQNFRVRRVRLLGDSSLTIHGDGEPLASARPAGTTIEVWPGALQVIC